MRLLNTTFSDLKIHVSSPYLELRQIYAFVRRDARTFTTYRSWILMTGFGWVTSALSLIFLGSYGRPLTEGLARYDADYLSFLIMGNAIQAFLGMISGIAHGRQWEVEDILASPIRLRVLMVSAHAWAIVLQLINVGVVVSIGTAFGMRLRVNIVLAALVFLFAACSSLGLGLMSSGISMVTRRPDPITWLLGILTSLASGTLFPVTVLPDLVRVVSWVLPNTYVLDLWRLATLRGADLSESPGFGNPDPVWLELLKLATIGTITLTIGIIVFKKGLRKAKKDGLIGFV